jgi:hypothetical protein
VKLVDFKPDTDSYFPAFIESTVLLQKKRGLPVGTSNMEITSQILLIFLGATHYTRCYTSILLLSMLKAVTSVNPAQRSLAFVKVIEIPLFFFYNRQ